MSPEFKHLEGDDVTITLDEADYLRLSRLWDRCLDLESRGFTITKLRLPAECMEKWLLRGGWTSCQGYFLKFHVEFTGVICHNPRRLGVISSD